MKLALRVDVDTLRGTREGVPSLCRALDKHGVRAAFFFSVGPDNMGRHLWRLLKPQFMVKMLRTKAASLYGLDILLMGTAWPGPRIGRRNEAAIRDCAKAGHELGVHAWDHYTWQAKLEKLDSESIARHMRLAFDELSQIAGRQPECSAAPGWKCDPRALLVKAAFPFKYNSDCRGSSIFRPLVAGKTLSQPQIPVNLPTYDEMLGRDGVTNESYNELLLAKLNPDGMNVLTIHAEAEGGVCAPMFDDFLARCKAQGISIVPPGELLPSDVSALPAGAIAKGEIPGREGWLAVQSAA